MIFVYTNAYAFRFRMKKLTNEYWGLLKQFCTTFTIILVSLNDEQKLPFGFDLLRQIEQNIDHFVKQLLPCF